MPAIKTRTPPTATERGVYQGSVHEAMADIADRSQF
jgi:hypothetical protein